MQLQSTDQVSGREAWMNRATLNKLRLKAGRMSATVVLSHRAPDVELTLVASVSDQPQDDIVFVPGTVRTRFAPSGMTGTFSVNVALASPYQRFRLFVTAARISPIVAILAAIVTGVAVFTGNATAPGLNAVKIVAAAFVLLSAVCSGWVGFRSA